MRVSSTRVGPAGKNSCVPVDVDGAFCIYNEQPVHLVVDLQGTFSASGAQQFFPAGPTRVLDTRSR